MRATIKNNLVLLLFAVLFTPAHSHQKVAPPLIKSVHLNGGVKITPQATVLQHSGDWVAVTWSTLESADNMMISVFSPASTNFTQKSPVKWMTIQGTSGSVLFQLTNLRTDYAFVLVENTTVVAVSESVTFVNPNEPLQAHLALTADPSTVGVMWNTRNSTNPIVKWGTKSGIYSFSAPAQTHTYTPEDVCGDPAKVYGWIDPGLFHEAFITNLQPGVMYYYVVGDDAYGWTEERTVMGPRVTETSSTVAFIAYGDMGKLEADTSTEHWPEPGSLATTNRITTAIMQHPYDTIIHIGDISYAVGYAAQWDTFFRLIEPFASRVPYMVCPGNHEYDFTDFNWLNTTDSGGECGVPYRNRFHMPLLGPASSYYSNHSSNWYSFNVGPVHVLLMDTEESFESLQEGQLQFIAQDLASVNRQVTPFVIFAGHRPMYVSSTNVGGLPSDQGMASHLREYVEPLLYKYKVDLAMWGHVHAYQRTCPVYNETCVSDGTIHVIIGMAGAGLSTDAQFPPPVYTEYFDYINFGYANITVSPELLHLQYITTEGAINDEVYIKSRY